jgi:outer membrane receptor for ferric coprogen and ferric-rhodotorulic acid
MENNNSKEDLERSVTAGTDWRISVWRAEIVFLALQHLIRMLVNVSMDMDYQRPG